MVWVLRVSVGVYGLRFRVRSYYSIMLRKHKMITLFIVGLGGLQVLSRS